MMKNVSVTEQDLKVLYDLSIYNCAHFDPYTQIIYEDQQQTRAYTNVELAREAAQLSEGLRSLGIKKGDRVLVMMINCPEVLISYQAIARVGAVAIPVLPLLKGPEVHYIAQNSGARAILTGAVLLPLLRSALTDLPAMRYTISTGISDSQFIDEQTAPQVLSYSSVLARGKADNFTVSMEDVSISPDDTAVILYTSGTTGNPKGVMLSHNNLMQNALSSRSAEPESETHEANLAILPLAHAYGILMSNIAYLTGTRVVMHPRFDTTAVLSAVERHRITAFAGVPAMFVALLFTPDADKYDTSSLQYCVSGSAPLPIHILQGFEQKFHCEMREGYGLSEGTTALTGHTSGLPVRPGSVGKPLPGVEVRVVFQNYEDLADVVTRHMQQLPTITKTHTLMAFQCYSRADLQQAWDIGVE
jgi:long-chain acyl-CoA synthetase